MENKVIHIINDKSHNEKTAPQLKLKRPKINYFLAITYIISHLILAYFITVLTAVILNENHIAVWIFGLKYFAFTALLLFIFTLRFSCIWFVKLYQRYAKAETRLRCHMTPSCSAYAILAFKKYGAVIGGIKAYRRLKRCGPFGGIDYP